MSFLVCSVIIQWLLEAVMNFFAFLIRETKSSGHLLEATMKTFEKKKNQHRFCKFSGRKPILNSKGLTKQGIVKLCAASCQNQISRGKKISEQFFKAKTGTFRYFFSNFSVLLRAERLEINE